MEKAVVSTSSSPTHFCNTLPIAVWLLRQHGPALTEVIGDHLVANPVSAS